MHDNRALHGVIVEAGIEPIEPKRVAVLADVSVFRFEEADARDLVVTEIDERVGDETGHVVDEGEVLVLDEGGDLAGGAGRDLQAAERCVHFVTPSSGLRDHAHRHP